MKTVDSCILKKILKPNLTTNFILLCITFLILFHEDKLEDFYWRLYEE